MGSSEYAALGRPGDRTPAQAAMRAGHREPSLLETIQRAWREMRDLIRDHAMLAVLETQRAALSLAQLIATAFVVAILGLTAWLALLSALVVWLGREYLSLPALLAIVAALNLALAVGLALWAKRFFTDLPFSATLRQLTADQVAMTGNDDATV